LLSFSELLNLDDREKFLEQKLHQAEEAISYLQEKFLKKQPSSEEMKVTTTTTTTLTTTTTTTTTTTVSD